MIHQYYREGIMRLAALPQVVGISCQTNLSFPSDHWLDELQTAPNLMNKIKVWASFHPEMTSVDKFVRQLHTLHQAGMQVCAGAVGNPSAKAILLELRNALSPDIYLFINAMQGLKTPLGREDIQFFSQLDNLFEYDLRNAPAQWNACSGGISNCFVDWKGDIYACPRSQVKIGNLYQSRELTLSFSCRRKVCDCYIAFSNLCNHPLRKIMGEGAFWRIPEKPEISTVFFDVDGTLTDARGNISESYATALRYMAMRSTSLYIATSLSLEQARRKLGNSLFSLFNGGVFADGGLLSFDDRIKCMPIDALPDICKKATKTTAHKYEDWVYKYSMLVSGKELRAQMLTRLKERSYQVFHRPPLVTVVHGDASKREGVLHICRTMNIPLDQVLIVGNSLSDWPMMSVFTHSCAVMNAEPLLKERARYTLNPDRLPAFFRFEAKSRTNIT